ncbi:hypothetical protein GCM10010415_72770 [Streptomyces atrovirens]|uniref:Restriction endonuclease n=1 Tax=Streptomyces atrovirens TaxID=285556 RepID=A0ABW0E4L1_9ACTN
MTLERLVAQAHLLDDAQLEMLSEMAEALREPCEVRVDPSSDLASDRFIDYFLNRLKIHHATSEEKFKKASFEYAFIAAARYSGVSATKTRSQTFQGADATVDGVRWSLKTEASAKISKSTIVVSKFSEARWIRDCETPGDFLRECVPRFLRHLDEYDRIATLRAFSVGRELVRYDLIEIPKGLLANVANLSEGDFTPRTKNGGSSALVRDSRGIAFKVVLDGSVEKITLSRLPVQRCWFHASWIVPTIPEDEE